MPFSVIPRTLSANRYAQRVLRGLLFHELQTLFPVLPTPRQHTYFKITPAHNQTILDYTDESLQNIVGTPFYAPTYRELINRRQIRIPNLIFDIVIPRNPRARPHLRARELPFPQHLPLLYDKNDKRPSAVAIGPILSSDPVIVNYRSSNNQIRGILKRCCLNLPYQPHEVQNFRQFVRSFIRTNYQPIQHIDFSHENLDKYWLHDSKRYTLKQKKHFHDLLDQYLSHGNYKQFIKQKSASLYLCNSFIKREFYSEPKEARIINARSEMFRALVGPCIKEIEHAVIYNRHFIKGKQPQDVVNRMLEIQKTYTHIAETDYSSFEGSFNQDVLQACEYDLFHYMLANNPGVWKIIKQVYVTKSRLCFSTTPFHDISVFPGSRMSGDMWTSLGNGFTNMMLFLYCAKNSMTRTAWRNTENKYDFLVEGDDGFFGYDFDLDLTRVSRLGFVLKLAHAEDINQLSFCGIKISPSGHPIPDVPRVLEKFGYDFDDTIINNYSTTSTNHEMKLMRAKAMSLLATGPGCPILQPLAQKVLELTQGLQPRINMFDWWDTEVLDITHVKLKPVEITLKDRQYFSQTYHISVAKQIMIETFIHEQTQLRFELPFTRHDLEYGNYYYEF